MIRCIGAVPYQPGHWFMLDMVNREIETVRQWLETNLGRQTTMVGAVSENMRATWVPVHPERSWTICGDTVVIWDKQAAALFMTFHPLSVA
jgi:hypothetical protein